jgi:phenylacetate-CoA ligase
MSPEAMRELQDRRVRDLVARILQTPVPLFRRKLEAAGISDARDVRGVEDLERVPLTVKQELRDSEAAVPPWGDYRFTDPRAAVRLGTSTGTTGEPTISIWTRHDLWIEYESAARNWWRSGHRPGMIVTHAHPAYLYGGGTMLTGAYEYFGLLTIWVPPPDTDELAEQALRFWLRVRPDLPFMGFSTGRFLEVAGKLGIDPADAGLRPGAPPGFGIGRGLPLMTAGIECYAYLASGCGKEEGGHVAEDWAVVQAVDPTSGRSVPDGEWGNLVVTTLDRDNGLLRYDLEEACALLRSPCSCGETTVRGVWGGRFKDLLSSQGKRFQLSELESALRAVGDVASPTLEYQVVRPRSDEGPLSVRVEAPEGAASGRHAEELARRLAESVRASIGVVASVEMLERGSLPRAGYKATRVVDR